MSEEGRVGTKKPPMVGGAKFGLCMVGAWVLLLAVNIIYANSTGASESTCAFLCALWFFFAILIAVAGLVTGIQKGRVGIGILAFFLAPIGFLFALAAENRKAQAEERPDCLEGIISEDNLMPVEEFARQKGLSPDQVVQQIKDGKLAGQISGEQWYVNIELTSKMSR